MRDYAAKDKFETQKKFESVYKQWLRELFLGCMAGTVFWALIFSVIIEKI